jgi:hypothetical protein
MSRVPTSLDRIVQRCLEKRPEERFRSAADLACALHAAADPDSSAVATAAPPSAAVRTRRAVLAWASIASVAAVASLPIVVRHFGEDVSPAPVVRFTIEVPDVSPVTGGGYHGPAEHDRKCAWAWRIGCLESGWNHSVHARFRRGPLSRSRNWRRSSPRHDGFGKRTHSCAPRLSARWLALSVRRRLSARASMASLLRLSMPSDAPDYTSRDRCHDVNEAEVTRRQASPWSSVCDGRVR